MPSAHAAQARATVGPDALLAHGHTVALSDDVCQAHSIADWVVDFYASLTNYGSNSRRVGFTEAEVAAPRGRVFDEVIAHGTPEQVAAQVGTHLDAGANHVALRALGDDYVAVLRTLAPVLNSRG